MIRPDPKIDLGAVRGGLSMRRVSGPELVTGLPVLAPCPRIDRKAAGGGEFLIRPDPKIEPEAAGVCWLLIRPDPKIDLDLAAGWSST